LHIENNLYNSNNMRYNRKGIYSIEAVLGKILPGTGNKNVKVDFDGDLIKMNSQRYFLFKYKGCTCVKCGLDAEYFAKEKSPAENVYHFNLYGLDKDGKEVMFTKDHILPRSKGGLDKLDNYQVMCEVCNREKGNKIEGVIIPVKFLIQKVEHFDNNNHSLGYLNECEHTHLKLRVVTENLEGYYLKYNDEKILIDKFGVLSEYPKGLYDTLHNLMIEFFYAQMKKRKSLRQAEIDNISEINSDSAVNENLTA